MFARRVAPAVFASFTALTSIACDQPRGVTGPGADVAPDPAQLHRSSLDYVAVDLGTLGGATSVARGINDRGQVVGNSFTAAGRDHAFLWTEGVGMVDLGTLPGGRSSTANAINNAGVVVGFAVDANGDERPVLWTADGRIRDLDIPDGFTARAVTVDERGVVGGAVRPKGIPFVTHATRWQPDGTMENLGTFGGLNASIAAVNTGGDITVNVNSGPFVTHVLFIERNRTPIDIGNLGGTSEQGGALALGMSVRGHITGITETVAGDVHAFLWTKADGMRDLGALDPNFSLSQGRDVNTRGVTVGGSWFGVGLHAFVWTSDKGMRDLGTLGGRRSEAFAINEAGDIAGTAEIATPERTTHATLWRPRRHPGLTGTLP